MKLTSSLLAVFLTIGIALIPGVALADSTIVVVSPGNMHGWGF